MDSVTDTPADRAEAYRRLFGSFVELDAHDRITLLAHTVHAVQVCPALAEPMLAQLHTRGVRTPIIDNPLTGWRTFLTTAPPAGDQRPVQFYLPGSTVHAARTVTGCPIPLPSPDDPHRTWHTDPWHEPLARFDTIADLVPAAVASLKRPAA
ncbi:hypothetical protein IU487_14190 [Nocardia puris]|uniref:hypothetical protein n=1 Tax=Nocardia puris TaxID=208602 RepID=UPI0018944F9B|nr:hypothetical protein [Nocardia puris]MBF6212183.1 hypothetical protein [Nocardia puris]